MAHTFTFQTLPDLPSSTLSASTTHAKVAFVVDATVLNESTEIFQDAKLVDLANDNKWQVSLDTVPRLGDREQDSRVLLYVTRGEHGKLLGTVELGNMRLHAA